LHEYQATYRLDEEEEFYVDVFSFFLETTDLAEAAKEIQQELGYRVTLIELKRIV
jgi:hypothetical protein